MTAKIRMLSRDDILNADDRKTEIVAVPEWGGAVTVRSLTGLERDRYEGSMVSYKRNAKGVPEIDAVETDNVRARLASMTIIDEAGGNLFTEGDVLILGMKSAAALERVFKVAQRLSNLSDADVEALTEQLGKGQSAPSGSASPETSA